ncbi:unnamed protein product [Natator depressus]
MLQRAWTGQCWTWCQSLSMRCPSMGVRGANFSWCRCGHAPELDWCVGKHTSVLVSEFPLPVPRCMHQDSPSRFTHSKIHTPSTEGYTAMHLGHDAKPPSSCTQTSPSLMRPGRGLRAHRTPTDFCARIPNPCLRVQVDLPTEAAFTELRRRVLRFWGTVSNFRQCGQRL